MNKYYLRSMVKPFYKIKGKTIFIKNYQLDYSKYFLSKKALKYVYKLRDEHGYSVQIGI